MDSYLWNQYWVRLWQQQQQQQQQHQQEEQQPFLAGVTPFIPVPDFTQWRLTPKNAWGLLHKMDLGQIPFPTLPTDFVTTQHVRGIQPIMVQHTTNHIALALPKTLTLPWGPQLELLPAKDTNDVF